MAKSNRFALSPTIKFKRSKFDLNHEHLTTMNVGDLVPVYVKEVLPGDTFRLDSRFLARLTSSFVKVPLGSLFLDVRYFFVPNRIIWNKWVNLMGENTSGYWVNQNVSTVPQVTYDATSAPFTAQTLYDYLGFKYPGSATAGRTVSQLPFRAFAKIWNDWYRNENTQAPVEFEVDSEFARMNSGVWAPNNIFGMPPKVSKTHDYFTSCLPAPQKGDPVDIPLSGLVNVSAYPSFHSVQTGVSLHFSNSAGSEVTQGNLSIGNFGSSPGYLQVDSSSVGSNIGSAQPDNLYGDLSSGTAGTVNDIRYAFALQRLLEADARYGTRYTEMIEGHFGVRNPDARLQRSEYLGGSSNPVLFQEVAQTSQGTSSSPQANLSSYSKTFGDSGFIKSFTEFGWIIGVACIRQNHIYSQGIDRFWDRLRRTDFYDPVFANIGEQPVYTSELWGSALPSTIFGYQEAWADYRYHPSRVSGFQNPSLSSESLAVWNFADNYSTAPVLNQSFLNETSQFVDRTLSIPSGSTPNFLVDFSFNVDAVRVMPTYSIPSLIDHVGNH